MNDDGIMHLRDVVNPESCGLSRPRYFGLGVNSESRRFSQPRYFGLGVNPES
jgi:hypothetical protein